MVSTSASSETVRIELGPPWSSQTDEASAIANAIFMVLLRDIGVMTTQVDTTVSRERLPSVADEQMSRQTHAQEPHQCHHRPKHQGVIM